MKRLTLAFALASSALLSACVVVPAHRAGYYDGGSTVVVDAAPPAPYAEVVPVMPSPGAVQVQPEIACRLHRHGGKGLVDLPQIDVRRLHAGLAQRLLAGRRRAGQHDGGLAADDGRGTDAGAGLQARSLATGPGAHQHQG